jgi:WD40 repeat protein
MVGAVDPPADLSSARVVLLGTGTHEPGSDLLDVPAVRSTVTDLSAALIDRCGVAPGRIDVVLDAASPMEMGDAIAATAADAGDVLLLYYVGHGLISESGALGLACRASRGAGGLEHRTLAYATVRRYLADYLQGGPARSVVAVLDCCFSGQAVGSLGEASDLAAISGAFVLTSAGRDELAMAPSGARHTAFSGALLRLIQTGDPALPARITLLDAVRHLSRVLPEAGFPRPRCRADGLAGTRVLIANPVTAVTPTVPGASRPGIVPGGKTPYRGLAYFGTGDAAWFFGRERMVAQLVGALGRRYDDPAPLLLVGASGAGKSSLLRAGLLPALGYGDLPVPGSAQWPRVVLTPGGDPFWALAKGLAPVLDRDPGELAGTLRGSVQGLAEALAKGPGQGWRVVLVVDQFEEVFTACRDDAVRARFVAALCAAATGEQPRALAVLGVRADFYAQCADHAGLAAALQDPVLVGPMRVAELHDAIEKPAALAGLAVQPGLVGLLLADLGVQLADRDHAAPYEPGRLPLLSHALLTTWRDCGQLTIEGYQATGGIGGALARTADQALQRVPPAGKATALALLLRLVQVGEASEDTRRRATQAQLTAEFPDAEVLDTVLAVFTAADTRLIIQEDGTVQLAHEALITAWPTLRGWLEEDRAGALAAQQLADAAQRWAADGEDPGQLYQGVRLDLAETLLDEPGPPAGPAGGPYAGALAGRFLRASMAARATARKAARRRRRRWYAAIAVMAVLVLVAGVTATAAVVSGRQRDAQQLLAAARTALNTADGLRTDHPADALRLGVTASSLASATGDATTIQAAHNGLVSTIAASWYLGALRTAPDLTGLDAGPGNWLLTLNQRGEIGLWDTSSGTAQPVYLGPAGGPVTQEEFTPARQLLVTVAANGPLTVWSLADRRAPRRLGSAPAGTVPITAIRASPDGTRLFTGDYDGSVAVWNLTNPAHPVRQGGASPPCWPRCDPVQDMAMRADGKTLVSVDRTAVTTWHVPAAGNPRYGGVTQLPDLGTAFAATNDFSHLSIVPELDTSISTSIRPDGMAVAVGGSTGNNAAAALLAGTRPDPAQPGHTRVLALLPGHELHVDQVLFSHDGTMVATLGAQGSVQLWSVTNPDHPVLEHVLPDQGPQLAGVTFSADDGVLFTATRDGTVSRYSTQGLAEPIGAETLPSTRWLVWADPESTDVVTTARPDAYEVAAADLTHRILVTSTPASESVRLLMGGQGSVPGDKSDGTFSVWQLNATGPPGELRKLRTIQHQHSITALTLAPVRHLLVVGTGLGGVDLWDLTRPSQPRQLSHMDGARLGIGAVEITAVAVSPDGRTLAIGTAGMGVIIMNISDTSRPLQRARLTEPEGPVHGLAFSSDGTTLATGSSDGLLRLWDVHGQGKPSLTSAQAGTGGPIVSAAYSPRTRLLATGAADGTVTLWDATDPQDPVTLQTLAGPADGAGDVQFSADGQYLAATDELQKLTRWYVQAANNVIADPFNAACNLAPDPRCKPVR